jgi:hypothetical protein
MIVLRTGGLSSHSARRCANPLRGGCVGHGIPRAFSRRYGRGERRGKLHVGGPAKLVDRLHPIEAISRLHEDRGITREGHGVAGHGGDARHLGLGERAGLRLGPRAGRVDDHGVEACQFRRQHRTAEQIAHLGRHRLQLLGMARALVERRQQPRPLRPRGPRRPTPAAGRMSRTPRNRSAMRVAPSVASLTADSSAASPCDVACRNAPGGGVTDSRSEPHHRRHGCEDRLILPCQPHEAARVGAQRRAQRPVQRLAPCHTQVHAAPLSVSWQRTEPRPASRQARDLPRTGTKVISSGASTWHSVIGTIVSDRRAWKPTSAPFFVRRPCQRRAPPRPGRGRRDGPHRRLQPLRPQRRFDDAHLPPATNPSEACIIAQPPQLR